MTDKQMPDRLWAVDLEGNSIAWNTYRYTDSVSYHRTDWLTEQIEAMRMDNNATYDGLPSTVDGHNNALDAVLALLREDEND